MEGAPGLTKGKQRAWIEPPPVGGSTRRSCAHRCRCCGSDDDSSSDTTPVTEAAGDTAAWPTRSRPTPNRQTPRRATPNLRTPSPPTRNQLPPIRSARRHAAEGEPVKIGLITESGGEAISSQSELTETGAQIAADYLNEYRGGLAGQPIELVICGNKASASGAARLRQPDDRRRRRRRGLAVHRVRAPAGADHHRCGNPGHRGQRLVHRGTRRRPACSPSPVDTSAPSAPTPSIRLTTPSRVLDDHHRRSVGDPGRRRHRRVGVRERRCGLLRGQGRTPARRT